LNERDLNKAAVAQHFWISTEPAGIGGFLLCADAKAEPSGAATATPSTAAGGRHWNNNGRARFEDGALRSTGLTMKKIMTFGAVALLVAGATITDASAKKMRHHHRHSGQGMSQGMSQGMNMGPGTTTGAGRGYGGNNAELMGNNGNSAQGSNSLGHIQGGNLGGGK
jgi:hypothetical protein